MHRGWPADQVKVIGFVDSQSFMDVTMRVDICSHRTIERQAGEERQRDGKMLRSVKLPFKSKT